MRLACILLFMYIQTATVTFFDGHVLKCEVKIHLYIRGKNERAAFSFIN